MIRGVIGAIPLLVVYSAHGLFTPTNNVARERSVVIRAAMQSEAGGEGRRNPTRRGALASLSFAAIVSTRAVPAQSATSLRARVDDRAVYAIPCGVEAPDVYYPPWMSGTWAAESTTLAVESPSVRKFPISCCTSFVKMVNFPLFLCRE